jgi:hypothetical protein
MVDCFIVCNGNQIKEISPPPPTYPKRPINPPLKQNLNHVPKFVGNCIILEHTYKVYLLQIENSPTLEWQLESLCPNTYVAN